MDIATGDVALSLRGAPPIKTESQLENFLCERIEEVGCLFGDYRNPARLVKRQVCLRNGRLDLLFERYHRLTVVELKYGIARQDVIEQVLRYRENVVSEIGGYLQHHYWNREDLSWDLRDAWWTFFHEDYTDWVRPAVIAGDFDARVLAHEDVSCWQWSQDADHIDFRYVCATSRPGWKPDALFEMAISDAASDYYDSLTQKIASSQNGDRYTHY